MKPIQLLILENLILVVVQNYHLYCNVGIYEVGNKRDRLGIVEALTSTYLRIGRLLMLSSPVIESSASLSA